MALRQHIVDTINQSYVIAAKDLHNNTLQLQKTHVAIQVLLCCLTSENAFLGIICCIFRDWQICS